MCGVVAAFDLGTVERGVEATRHRGPDAMGIVQHGGVALGHARLAVVDLDPRSDQPFVVGRTTLSYNGEVWNHKAVRAELQALGRRFRTAGDTEVVATALDEWGWEGLLRLDGMFAAAWTHGDGQLWLARDRFGEIPLHYTETAAASELKVLQAAGRMGPASYVPPGAVVVLGNASASRSFSFHTNGQPEPSALGFEAAASAVRSAVIRGVADRTMADVPVCALLSGGLDSTVVAWSALQAMPALVTYVAVQDRRSSDLRMARMAASDLGVDLREVDIPAPTPTDLARTVAAIELPHKAQVEIGWACLVLAARIRSDGFKVVFSGEGSDELWGSYGFAYHGIKAEGWHAYRRRLFLDQHRKNFARCNKAFMTAGVECRLPFLHPPLVDLAWSLPETSVRRDRRPKAVLEEAFKDVVPRAILRRAKVAFQEGLGMREAAAAAVDAPATFYRETFERMYGETVDRRRGAGADRGSTEADHGRVRPEAGDAQRDLF